MESKVLRSDAKDEFLIPRKLRWPLIAAFWSKIACVLAAYVVLLLYLIVQLG